MEVVYLKRAWTKTVLEWRCHLLRMAIDILSIPAMSAEAGRVFSGVRCQIPRSRARLGARTVEQMECLKHWLRKGWLDQLNVDLPLEEGGGEGKSSILILFDMEPLASMHFPDVRNTFVSCSVINTYILFDK